ncbi:hypothetical protein CVT24_009266 [Panaeolus cyanescens]|uniref:Uncharacterized protein n=1 Tax=Panaeolus cyanescens TaxID=181874 RepID=A0A409Y7V3_9AGAR|nr:hypothetical protein CVT24_009266 [Panaeolus cyanescens]
MHSGLSTYVEEIARKRALESDIIEVPASPPRGDDEPNEDRIAQLKKRVEDVYKITRGNPSDGQWAKMSRVLRLGVTSGRHRWIGTRKDLKAPEEHKEVPWINAETEQEWSQWERRASTVDKVKTWNRQVEESSLLVEPVEPLSTPSSQLPKSQEPPKAQVSLKSTPVDPLDAPTPLGFSVVKRVNKTTANGKPSRPTASQNNGRKGSMGPPPTHNEKPSKPNDHNQLPEPSLPAPSFSSSKILTSTPKPVPGAPSAKPVSRQSNPLQDDSFLPATPSLPERQTTTPPPVSNSNPKAPPLNNTQSLPAIPMPQKPTRSKPTFSSSNVVNANNKRILELEELQTNKKARADRKDAADRPKTPEAQIAVPSTSRLPEPSPSPRFIACATNPLFAEIPREAPVTPPRKSKPLPTLTELLASGKKNKEGKKPSHITPKPIQRTAAKPSSKGKEKEVIPDDEPSNALEETASKAPETDTSMQGAQVLDSLPVPDIPEDVIDDENPYMLNPDAIHVSSDEIDLLLSSKEVDLSPAKSLSSIADSDEEDDDDDPCSPPPDSSPIVGTFSFNPSGFTFNPQATSTQNPYASFSALNASPGVPAEQSFNFLGGSFPFRSSMSSVGSKGPAASSRYAYKSKQSGSQNDGAPGNSMDSWASVYKHRSFQYNSQLQSTIAKQVDQVDKLLEKDVDYEGWLKDPTPEPKQDGGVEESP